MAGENLQAFEKLKETTANSLDSREKAELNEISSIDFQSQKAKIENKTFNIGWKTMKLKDIVDKLQFDATWNKATLNWQSIALRSELWAAIQVYAIAHNKPVGSTRIDGSVWRNTVSWLTLAQTETRSRQVNRSPETTENISIGNLTTTSFTQYFSEYNKKIFINRKIINSTNWALNPINKSTYQTDKSLKFRYLFNGKTVELNIPISMDSNYHVNPKNLADKIVKEAARQEGNINTNNSNERAEDGINSFKVDDIKDPVIKKWATLKNIKFHVKNYWNNGRMLIADKNWKDIGGDRSGGWFMMTNTEVLTNGKFDKAKFNKKLTSICYAKAKPAVREDFDKTLASINKKSPSALTTKSGTQSYVTRCTNLLKSINGMGHASDFADLKWQTNALKEKYESQWAYIDASTTVKESTAAINYYLRNDGFSRNFDNIIATLKKVVWGGVYRKWQWKYELNYKNTLRGAYWKIWKKDEYTRAVDSLIRQLNGKTIKVWGETIKYQFVAQNRNG